MAFYLGMHPFGTDSEPAGKAAQEADYKRRKGYLEGVDKGINIWGIYRIPFTFAQISKA